MRTTEQSKRTVRVLAVGGALVATAGVGVAFAANPHPATSQPEDARLTSLQNREAQLVRQARFVNAEHDAVWSQYRAALADRQAEIRDANEWNAQVRAQAQANAAAASSGGYSSGSSGSSSSSGASPSAGYVPAPPVASSGSS